MTPRSAGQMATASNMAGEDDHTDTPKNAHVLANKPDTLKAHVFP